jgi:hypothetical protein
MSANARLNRSVIYPDPRAVSLIVVAQDLSVIRTGTRVGEVTPGPSFLPNQPRAFLGR